MPGQRRDAGGVGSSYSVLKSCRRRAISAASVDGGAANRGSRSSPTRSVSRSVRRCRREPDLPDESAPPAPGSPGARDSVRIEEDAIEAYAAGLPATEPTTRAEPSSPAATARRAPPSRSASTRSTSAPAGGRRSASDPATAATRRSPPGSASASRERRRLDGGGAGGDRTPRTIAAVLGQDPEHPLMTQFAAALRDVGEPPRSPSTAAASAAVVDARPTRPPPWPACSPAGTPSPTSPDTKGARSRSSSAPSSPRPTSHRAGVADLRATSTGSPPSPTTWSPTSSALDGVLHLDPGPDARAIEAGELLDHGSPEEVELRAGAVHAVELLAAAHRRPHSRRPRSTPPSGTAAALAATSRVPRPRSRNTAY